MDILINNTSEIPIYRQIKDQIKDAIYTGQIKEGEILPSIRKLANETMVSVLTTKRAYDELEAEGYVNSVPGKGFFVSSTNMELFREEKLRLVEAKLLEAYVTGQSAGLTKDEMLEMMSILYES
ncbi:GntR family transcriptional regulator [Diplocloster modestus]|uniref:GntR family transcriptional regulator n=1 Tax=Diplocloster modestus TaxID=2850322 RepID=A0ABS6K2W8_9FIRM|nr:GntR family transcriptional regulator [Diplocloster modestus]MBU9724859.1 GntR family transcriptional regulator [Diplocloster modestus]